MENLQFIAIVATAALLIFWYLQNLCAGAAGARGLLAVKDDPEAAKPGAKKGSYRVKARRAPRMGERRVSGAAGPQAKKTYNVIGDVARMRRRFRHQDEARYRAKDKAAPLRRAQEDNPY